MRFDPIHPQPHSFYRAFVAVLLLNLVGGVTKKEMEAVANDRQTTAIFFDSFKPIDLP